MNFQAGSYLKISINTAFRTGKPGKINKQFLGFTGSNFLKVSFRKGWQLAERG